MRTTLDIEDDVLQATKELAQRDGRPAGQVLSELARRGLAAPRARRQQSAQLRDGVAVIVSRGEVVTLEHVHGLGDQEGV